VRTAEERQQVVLADAVKRNVSSEDGVIPLVLEQGVPDNGLRVRAVALGEIPPGLRDSTWRLGQTLAIRILANREQQGPGYLGQIVIRHVR
jgi:hypothetical protein